MSQSDATSLETFHAKRSNKLVHILYSPAYVPVTDASSARPQVMKTENDMFDVRFFGEPHERAIVPRSQIRPITTSLQAMQVS